MAPTSGISHDPNESGGRRRSREPVKPLKNLAELLADCKTEQEKEELRDQLLEQADDIWFLVDEKRKHGNRLPPRSRQPVAAKWNLSEDEVDRLVQKMIRHEADRKKGLPVGSRVNVVIQNDPGRRKGTFDTPEQIQHLIIDAWCNPDWDALNHLGLTDGITHSLNRKMIYKFIKAKYPKLKISQTTVWRIITSFENTNTAESHWTRGKRDQVRDNILAFDVDFGAPNDFWILDVRPLPNRSQYKSILCTVGLLYIMDASSTKILRHKILPRQDEDNEGHQFGIDYTCQHLREEIAMAIIEYGRPRIIYIDNASIHKVLHKFLDLITPEGEEPTQIIHTLPDEPRGRGVTERALALMDLFGQYKPGFYIENNYRKSLKNKKNYKFYEFSFLEKEFEHFIPFQNARQPGEGQLKLPSPSQRYEQGPNKRLSSPPELQLALFGGTVLKDKRVPSRKGVRYSKTWYVPASEAPEVGVMLASAAIAKRETPLLVAQIGDFTALYVQLDGKTWEPFIEASKRRWSAKKRTEWNNAVRQRLNDSQKASIERLQLALLTDIGTKLVIDPFNQDFIEHDPSDPQVPVLKPEDAGDETTENTADSQLPKKRVRKKQQKQLQEPDANIGDGSPGDGDAAPPSPSEQPRSPGFLSRRRQQLNQTEGEDRT